MQKVNEKPILFSGPMVRAILEGKKNQTRRIVDFKKIAKKTGATKGQLAYSETFDSWAVFGGNGGADIALCECPYGKKGDRLWVRETAIPDAPTDFYEHDNYTWASVPEEFRKSKHVFFKADAENPEQFVWKPSIHMPRWASRITLEITNVRVEKIQEGGDREFWGEEIWAKNPVVWVIEFKRLP